MHTLKRVLVPVLLIMALLVGTMPAFADATPSVTIKVLGKVSVKSATYTGHHQRPEVTVLDTDGKTVDSAYYTVKVVGYPKNVGKYTVKVSGKGPYSGTVTGTFAIKKAANPFRLSSNKTFRWHSYDRIKTIKVKHVREEAKLTWKSNNKNVICNDGVITIKGGFKGTAVIKVTSAATKNYKKTTKTITVTVK